MLWIKSIRCDDYVGGGGGGGGYDDDERQEESISENGYFCISLQNSPLVTVQQYFCTLSHSQVSSGCHTAC